MKSLKTFLFLSSFLSIVLFSCTKDEKKDYLVGGFAPVLTASTTGSVPLSFATKDDPAVTISWTNPNYSFTTGASSQDVKYLIEIDTTGANFTNPNKQTISVSKELSTTFTQTQFNDYLLNQLVLKPGMPHNLEMRVIAGLGTNNAARLVSNVLKFVVTPYAIPPKVTPPTTGHLYIVGSATAGGWNNPVPVPTQEFTKISETLYEITVPLIGGQEYLFLPLNGDWGHKYSVPSKGVAGLSEGGDFKMDASDNFPGPAASGNYKITVDFQRGKFTVTKV
ncbi:MAG: SusE outer membrane protein [Segetibacter sp.]|jgi:hypothetical protein|nr:SusE outer membrane protein [Segetibacter sp.]